LGDTGTGRNAVCGCSTKGGVVKALIRAKNGDPTLAHFPVLVQSQRGA